MSDTVQVMTLVGWILFYFHFLFGVTSCKTASSGFPQAHDCLDPVFLSLIRREMIVDHECHKLHL